MASNTKNSNMVVGLDIGTSKVVASSVSTMNLKN